MISNGNLQPVLVEGVSWSSDNAADVEGVRAGRVEISIISDFGREMIDAVFNF